MTTRHSPRPARFRAWARRADGFASTAVLALGMIVLLLAGLQAALWFVATNTLQAAANTGYSQARAYQASDETGEAAALQIIESAGGVRDVTITINRNGDTVTVTATGTIPTLLPGVNLPEVSREVSGPIERWVPQP